MANTEAFTKKQKIISILASIFTVFFIIVVLGILFNIYLAIGYLFILIIHEMGHCIAAKFLNIKIIFSGLTPFDAYIVHEDIKDCKKSAFVSIAGPLFGGILALIYYLAYCFTGNSTLVVLSFLSVELNLFNLIPVKPLDGGHIAAIISPILSCIGLIVLLYIVIISKDRFFLIVILAIGIGNTYEQSKAYYNNKDFKVNKNTKVKYTLFYGTLILLLGLSTLYFYKFGNIDASIIDIIRIKSHIPTR
ncbi:site-2 protease family protein [Clostridium estertheticum]|uniref:site-2 protease family protein n=1 Tax=Clostridium estertheticum TaxID=238834 RepID=UPI001CF56739|nr:site-2 protease family protein [Clostridium estertheticum]MCB2342448.1 site-2 protease family protein [Clostridium estertheticum]